MVKEILSAAFLENGIDILDILGAPGETRIEREDGTLIIVNPLREDFIAIAVSIQNIRPQNIVGNFLEFIVFTLCTVIFGIYASYVAVYDFKFKTYKILSVQYLQSEIIAGKLLSIIITMVFVLATAAFIVFIGSFFINSFVRIHVPIDEFAIDFLNYEHGLLLQALLSFCILIFYIILGFSIAFMSKTMIIPIIGLLLYGFFIPMLGPFDFRNIFSLFAHQVFSFSARFVMVSPIPVNGYLGGAFIIMTALGLMLLTIYVANKHSLFN